MSGSTLLDILMLVVLAGVCLLAVVATVVRLPGTWVIVAAAAAYGWLHAWAHVGPTLILILLGVAVFGELVELGVSVVAAKRAGASNRAGWGALIGGFVGMFVFSLPMPFVGTMFGALVGCFVGALIAELTVKQEFAHGTRVGTFAALGFVMGIVTKVALAMMMSVALLGVATYGSFSAATSGTPVKAPHNAKPSSGVEI